MSVIINEFELVPGPAPKSETTVAAPAAEPAPQPALMPENFERIAERQGQRLARLWAD